MPNSPLKIAFMGTPDFAATALQGLLDSDHDVAVVYSQPPRPKGRGHKVQKSPVHMLAEQNDIPVYTPKTLRSEEAQAEFVSHNVDVAVVAAYGLLLPEAVLNALVYGCLNIHGSLLPRWRGASPIQHAIWKGDEESGVTIMQMDKGMDTGAMIVKGEVIIDDEMTAAKLHDALAEIGASLAIGVLDNLSGGKKAHSEAQDNDLSTYAPLLKKSDGQINWAQEASDIDQQIRALNPWPGVWAQEGGKRFKIVKAELADLPDGSFDKSPGTVLNKDGAVLCGNSSVLIILSIQPEGKKAMDFASALNGNYISLDSVFS